MTATGMRRVAAAAAIAAVLATGCTSTAELTAEPIPSSPSAAQPEPRSATEPEPQPTSTPNPPAPPAMSGARVTGIIDGDTIDTTEGRIRVIGIDTPERGECGYTQATDHAARLVPVGSVVTLSLAGGKDDVDKYDRLLRYVAAANGSDLGLAQIAGGYAIARYDSRDGYGWHPKEEQYIAADAASPAVGCDTAQAPDGEAPGNPGLPLGPEPGPDLDCRDIYGPVWVGVNDWHRLDGDGDGIGCE
jgi:endonuclease YncB( thermonuclease family)